MTEHGNERTRLVRRGLVLAYTGLAYNLLESLVSLAAGLAAGSVALIGFGVDSMIELAAAGAALWRLHSDVEPRRRERSERVSLRAVGLCFLGLALFVAWESTARLLAREAASESLVGIAIAVASLIVMPVLARAKRGVAMGIRSGALAAEARQTMLCAWLSLILVVGLVLNAAFGVWWADPLAALLMVPIIGREGWESLQGRSDCCGQEPAVGLPVSGT